jgi:hypothetical protein
VPRTIYLTIAHLLVEVACCTLYLLHTSLLHTIPFHTHTTPQNRPCVAFWPTTNSLHRWLMAAARMQRHSTSRTASCPIRCVDQCMNGVQSSHFEPSWVGGTGMRVRTPPHCPLPLHTPVFSPPPLSSLSSASSPCTQAIDLVDEAAGVRPSAHWLPEEAEGSGQELRVSVWGGVLRWGVLCSLSLSLSRVVRTALRFGCVRAFAVKSVRSACVCSACVCECVRVRVPWGEMRLGDACVKCV